MLVHRSIADDFTAALAEHVRTLRVGDPLDDDTDVSALISTDETERVKSWIDDAVAEGAKVAGRRGGRRAAAPADRARRRRPDDMKVCRGEVFGPVVAIQAYDDLDEALRQRQRHALRPAGRDLHRRPRRPPCRRPAPLDFGGVLVNEVPTFRTDQMPYGGVRDSGNTKEGPHYAVREMTQERLVILQP